MLKLAALAYAPVAAVTFGALVLLSLLIAVPLSMLVAHRMLTRRERRLLDAHAGVGR